MKRFTIIIACLLSVLSAYGQAPEKMSYQAIVRDTNDNLLSNADLGIKISILEDASNGTAIYRETHVAESNVNGLLTLEIGTGVVLLGLFENVDWPNHMYYIKMEVDPNGGTDYSINGTSQLLTVPYAFHAKTANQMEESDPVFESSVAHGITTDDTAYWNLHTLDTDTHIDSTGIANLGYVAGAHVDSTDIANMGFVANTTASGTSIYTGNGTTPANLEVGITDHINFGEETLYLDEVNQKIGIGTSNPLATIEIADDNAQIRVQDTDPILPGFNPYDYASRFLTLYGSSATSDMHYGISARGFGNQFLGSMNFIQTTTTGFPNGEIAFYTTNSGNSAAAEKVRITGDGDVGIGTSTPAGQLELSQDQAFKPATSTWTISSDERLKNIVSNYAKGLEEILALKPIIYQYKNTNTRVFDNAVLSQSNVGFSAQEVQKIFPEAVSKGEDGYLSLNLHPVFVAYVNAIQEQQKEIDMLQEQVKLLTEAVQQLVDKEKQ